MRTFLGSLSFPRLLNSELGVSIALRWVKHYGSAENMTGKRDHDR
jgi:hypothetical protein